MIHHSKVVKEFGCATFILKDIVTPLNDWLALQIYNFFSNCDILLFFIIQTAIFYHFTNIQIAIFYHIDIL